MDDKKFKNNSCAEVVPIVEWGDGYKLKSPKVITCRQQKKDTV